MVAQVAQAKRAFQGVRPLNPARDLYQVARLLEDAFREDLGALHPWTRVPLLREVGRFFMTTAFMSAPLENLRGFVWEEEGRILGNVTLTLDDQKSRRWLVSNVAVAESYRRRGIGRRLMLAAMDEVRARDGRWLILNVRPHNHVAIRLYESLGFEIVDTEMKYMHTRRTPNRLSAMALPLRRLRSHELYEAYELARDALNERFRLFRPPSISEFGVHLEDRLAEHVLDLLVAQSTERWGYFEGKQLQAVVFLRAQRLGSTHVLDIRVRPARRGALEEGLVAAALARLGCFPLRDVEARIFTSHRELVKALVDAGFVPTRGMTLMAKELQP